MISKRRLIVIYSVWDWNSITSIRYTRVGIRILVPFRYTEFQLLKPIIKNPVYLSVNIFESWKMVEIRLYTAKIIGIQYTSLIIIIYCLLAYLHFDLRYLKNFSALPRLLSQFLIFHHRMQSHTSNAPRAPTALLCVHTTR